MVLLYWTEKNDIHDFMSLRNNSFPSMKFTFQIYNKEQIPLPYLLVTKNFTNWVEFDVFIQDT